MRQQLPTLMGGIEVAVGPRLPHSAIPAPPYFGRAPALENLKRVAETVRTTPECRCVTVVGAAGVGKTRLIDEFVRASRPVDDRPLRVFRSNAVEDGLPWTCFTQLLMQRFDVANTLGPEEAKLGVRAQVAKRRPQVRQTVTLIGTETKKNRLR